MRDVLYRRDQEKSINRRLHEQKKRRAVSGSPSCTISNMPVGFQRFSASSLLFNSAATATMASSMESAMAPARLSLCASHITCVLPSNNGDLRISTSPFSMSSLRTRNISVREKSAMTYLSMQRFEFTIRPFRNQLGHSDIECPYGKEIKVEEIRAG